MSHLSPECHAALTEAHKTVKSLAKVGRMLATPEKPGGYTAPAISLLLAGKYRVRNLTRIETAIRANLMNADIDCPAMGCIPLAQCCDWRRKADDFSRGNPQRVRMYAACNRCPHKKGDG